MYLEQAGRVTPGSIGPSGKVESDAGDQHSNGRGMPQAVGCGTRPHRHTRSDQKDDDDAGKHIADPWADEQGNSEDANASEESGAGRPSVGGKRPSRINDDQEPEGSQKCQVVEKMSGIRLRPVKQKAADACGAQQQAKHDTIGSLGPGRRPGARQDGETDCGERQTGPSVHRLFEPLEANRLAVSGTELGEHGHRVIVDRTSGGHGRAESGRKPPIDRAA